MGEIVAVGSSKGYLATPDKGAGPAVIVITEPGSTEHGHHVADILAAEGFAGLAPELRNGEMAGDFTAALAFLKPHPAVRGHGVGVIGFGAGVGLALWLGAHRPEDVAAVVAFYGVIPKSAEESDWSRLSAAVQAHYGEDDPACPPEAVSALEVTLGKAGVSVETFTYPGAGTAFFDDTRPEAHVEEAARQAWIRTLELLRKHLG
jgi:carboxymethylenebutenolidase